LSAIFSLFLLFDEQKQRDERARKREKEKERERERERERVRLMPTGGARHMKARILKTT